MWNFLCLPWQGGHLYSNCWSTLSSTSARLGMQTVQFPHLHVLHSTRTCPLQPPHNAHHCRIIRTQKVTEAKGEQRTTSGGRELDPPPLFACLLEITRSGVVGLGGGSTEVGGSIDGEGDSKGRDSDDGGWGAARRSPE